MSIWRSSWVVSVVNLFVRYGQAWMLLDLLDLEAFRRWREETGYAGRCERKACHPERCNSHGCSATQGTEAQYTRVRDTGWWSRS